MRELRITEDLIKTFGLDLRGFTVFTEAATGPFMWTAVSAAIAGADQVVAITKDSRYGTTEDVASAMDGLARKLGVNDRIDVVFDYERLPEADIITNSGAVRPLNRDLIEHAKPTAVAPLMWETWEWRSEDLDLAACADRSVMVLGTNERHPALETFRYVGLVAVKLLHEVAIEVFQSRVLVVGGGVFGEGVVDVLASCGAEVAFACRRNAVPEGVAHLWIGEGLDCPDVKTYLEGADGLVFAEHESEVSLLGPSGDLTVGDLRSINADLRIAHISGVVDAAAIRTAGFHLAPDVVTTAARTMSVTTAYLGPRPVIALSAAGLKVGEEMARARQAHRDFTRAKHHALKNPLCQDFPAELLQRFRGRPNVATP